MSTEERLNDARKLQKRRMRRRSLWPLVFVCSTFIRSQLYNFGETVSVVMWLDGWEPDSYYDKIASNMEKGLHTLCLLGTLSCLVFSEVVRLNGVIPDIKTKEQSIENMMKLVPH